MDMWSCIENGYAQLPPAEKHRVETEASPFGTHVQFHGFDGNNETEYMGAAQFLVDKLDRFSGFKGRDLNSHMPLSVETYRRMYAVFEPMRASVLVSRPLGATEIIALLKEKTHPENRR